MVLANKLKGWRELGTSNKNSPTGDRETFTLDGFYHRLTKWVAVDDQVHNYNLSPYRQIFILTELYSSQSIDVINCPELRDLLLYIGAQLEDSDIPHRTKLGELITARFKLEYANMVQDIAVCPCLCQCCVELMSFQNSLGRVSFTSDIWSRQNLESYMAITAHYMAKMPNTGTLVLKSQLIAFRRLQGSHTGENIGKVFVSVVKEIGCLHKVCLWIH
jgi:hypothetical protein